ncbi:MAG: sugar transferase [Chloroflexi bacterium HGW-Chloroflexi-7]|nr:MAG: sugar transferase [Chloroflexi bacterium HGW-Chloroflexi-7]
MQSSHVNKGISISKRLFDFLVSLVGIIVLLPVTLILMVLVWINLGGPVIFAQVRPGYHGKLFKLYKLRSMRNAYDAQGKPLPDDQRLTKFGKFLRASSLDELPELINVLLGQMSLVGPRPLLVAYLERYSPEQARRHDVLPGITGWAQVNGRNAISWEEKFKLDVWYVDHQSFWLDIKILLLTVKKVFKRESINMPGSATAPEFMGNNSNNTGN